MRRALVAIASTAAAVLLGIGCGGSDNGGDDLGAAVAHLPANTPLVDATDVDAVRRQLGLDPDADATDVQAAFGKGGSSDETLQRLVLDTGVGFAEVGQALQGAGDPSVAAAIDGSQLHAAAGTGQGDIQITALATSQSFDSVADALVAKGFTREGNVVAAPSAAEPIGGVADGGDGIIVLARTAQLARQAAEERTGPQTLAGLLDSVDEPVRTAALGSGCVSGIAAGQTADASAGTALVTLDGAADASRLDTKTLDSTATGFDFSAPKIDGDRLEIDYSGHPPAAAAPTPLEGLVQTFGVYSAYKCK